MRWKVPWLRRIWSGSARHSLPQRRKSYSSAIGRTCDRGSVAVGSGRSWWTRPSVCSYSLCRFLWNKKKTSNVKYFIIQANPDTGFERGTWTQKLWSQQYTVLRECENTISSTWIHIENVWPHIASICDIPAIGDDKIQNQDSTNGSQEDEVHPTKVQRENPLKYVWVASFP